jgi:hypothetical protein
MNNKKVDQMIFDGNQMLQTALEELNRPQEDVATLSVCRGTKLTMDLFVSAFLLKNNVDPEKFKSLNERYEKCKILDPDFSKVDIYQLDCLDKNACDMSRYCLSVAKVNECLKIAEDIRNKVIMS